ncbi:MAG: GGDEF domain-containing protein [Bryobacterales bacterium]|nr:GGDEF domain-containing protein [Bryobacterales bacterium]
METNSLVGALFLLVLIALLHENRRLCERASRLKTLHMELRQDLEVDPLTGLRSSAALARLRASDEAVDGVVAVLDLDHMKRVNDELGHLAGDEVLKEVGNLIRACIRKEDVACRWGGDEFMIVFRGQTAAVVQGRLRQIEERLWRFRLRRFGVFPLSISWGVVEARNLPLVEALAAADEQMYRMKRSRKREQAAREENRGIFEDAERPAGARGEGGK